ncbi:MAG: hypothetical protein NXI32_01800 [bacterium]|nr:hypothetical protein [bacterium]
MNSSESGSNNEQHEYQEEWLSAYLDGELAPHQVAIVEQRLQIDSVAQQTLLDLQRVRRLVGKLPAWTEDAFTAEQLTSIPTNGDDQAQDRAAGIQETIQAEWDEIVEGKLMPPTGPGQASISMLESESSPADSEEDEVQTATVSGDEAVPEKGLSPASAEVSLPAEETAHPAAAEELNAAAANLQPETASANNSESYSENETAGDVLQAEDSSPKTELENYDDHRQGDSDGTEVNLTLEAPETNEMAALPIASAEDAHLSHDSPSNRRATSDESSSASLNSETDSASTTLPSDPDALQEIAQHADALASDTAPAKAILPSTQSTVRDWKRPLSIAASVLAMASIGYLLWPIGKPASDLALQDAAEMERESSFSSAAPSRARESAAALQADSFAAPKSMQAEMAGEARFEASPSPANSSVEGQFKASASPIPTADSGDLATGSPSPSTPAEANVAGSGELELPGFDSTAMAGTEDRTARAQFPAPSFLPSPDRVGPPNAAVEETADLNTVTEKSTPDLEFSEPSGLDRSDTNDEPVPSDALAEMKREDPVAEPIVAEAAILPSNAAKLAGDPPPSQEPDAGATAPNESELPRTAESSLAFGAGDRSPAANRIDSLQPFSSSLQSNPDSPVLSSSQTSGSLPIARTQAWSAEEIESALRRIASFVKLPQLNLKGEASQQRGDQAAAGIVVPVLITSLAGSADAQELLATLLEQNQDLIAENYALSAANNAQEVAAEAPGSSGLQTRPGQFGATAGGSVPASTKLPVLLLLTRGQAEELLSTVTPGKNSPMGTGKFWFAGPGRPLADIAADEKIILLINVLDD